MKRLIAMGVAACILTGCATDGTASKQDVGTGMGVVIGGLAGSFLGKGSGRIVGALAGAALGGFIGNRIGAMLDEEDRRALQEKAKQVLVSQPDNSEISWSSDRSGATATVVPENSRVETREIKVVRDAGVAPAPQLDLIGAKYVTKGVVPVRLAPSDRADTATTLANGATIWAVGRVRNQPWIMVARGGKSIGYASAASLTPAPKPVQTAAAPVKSPAKPASAEPFDLDGAAPVRGPADLDALGPNEKADTVVASVACRDIRTTATAKGETATSTQTACRSPDGSWELN
ncbi:MAG: glycine zipper 2TM domain-containing protein [Alphaproteobacteria bacterium]|nr:glycine zipper 2TM domain-containing protein [Alphaproteobacteria bacterium]